MPPDFVGWHMGPNPDQISNLKISLDSSSDHPATKDALIEGSNSSEAFLIASERGMVSYDLAFE